MDRQYATSEEWAEKGTSSVALIQKHGIPKRTLLNRSTEGMQTSQNYTKPAKYLSQ